MVSGERDVLGPQNIQRSNQDDEGALYYASESDLS